jgi:hypothetical protein
MLPYSGFKLANKNQTGRRDLLVWLTFRLLIVEALHSSETSVKLYQIVRCHIQIYFTLKSEKTFLMS